MTPRICGFLRPARQVSPPGYWGQGLREMIVWRKATLPAASRASATRVRAPPDGASVNGPIVAVQVFPDLDIGFDPLSGRIRDRSAG